jgi:prepilin-type N-terminal cleavage/methylation domain-containing protein
MNQTKINNKQKGFTLIELLVVISVLGILATIALVSFTGSQKQARDVKRKSDISQYRLALENFANKNNGLYPCRPDATGVRASVTLCNDLGLTNCPEDPRWGKPGYTGIQYRYQSDGTIAGTITGTKYVLWGQLENVSSVAKFWVACSNGKTGEKATSVTPVSGACPI